MKPVNLTPNPIPPSESARLAIPPVLREVIDAAILRGEEISFVNHQPRRIGTSRRVSQRVDIRVAGRVLASFTLAYEQDEAL